MISMTVDAAEATGFKELQHVKYYVRDYTLYSINLSTHKLKVSFF